MEIGKTIQDSLGDFAQYFFTGSTTQLFDLSVYTVQAATLAVLHCDGYRAARVVKCAVVFADMFRGAFLVESQFALDLLFNVGVWVSRDDLDDQLASNPLARDIQVPYLERELDLPALKSAPCDRTTSALAQTPKLNDLLGLARRPPTIVVKILDIQRSPFLETELGQVWEYVTDSICFSGWDTLL